MKGPKKIRREILALKVRQWLTQWDKVQFSREDHKRRPDPCFYLFTLPATQLKALSGISRRTTAGGLRRVQDLGIQRRHDEARSDEIHRFVQYGYPWSELSETKRESGRFDNLRKPGWLPTAIVVNILRSGESRRRQQVAKEDLIQVEDSGVLSANITLPKNFTGAGWKPHQLFPIEVIDGQHRLWAFETRALDSKFELPVVAFHGLDIGWQAYLFWSINIKPKRINPSLAFDLYPLLRTEDWLEMFEGHSIYRETRAQELTEVLWSNPKSPWYHRINMLGERGQWYMVTQAAWIRSLMATYIKAWKGRGVRKIGGLFGASVGSHQEVLPWSRAQQAAFLILVGQKIKQAVEACREKWAQSLRRFDPSLDSEDNAFFGPHTLLSTDQGIRGLLYVTNDLCYARADELKLDRWAVEADSSASDERAVKRALASLEKQEVAQFLAQIARGLSRYDWRSSSFPDLTERERINKAAFRGSGGYKELRLALLEQLSRETGRVRQAAAEILGAIENR